MRARGSNFRSSILPSLAIAGLVALASPLPAAAADLNRAWSVCGSTEAFADERNTQCGALVNSG